MEDYSFIADQRYMTTFDFLAGGGEMGALMRSHDWAATSLGPPAIWPITLKTTLRLLLTSNSPMLIYWGPDLIQFYNDAVSLTLGPERHPSSLGQPAKECWGEAWHIIGPEIEYVLSGKGAVWHEETLVPFTRHGKVQDLWWSYGYSPIEDEEGVAGVLVICNDVTLAHQAKENLQQFHQALVESMDEGFCVVEMIFDEHGDPIDYRHLEVNPAYQQQSGLSNVLGRTIKEIVPDIECKWIETYGRVAATGKPIRFVDEAISLGRWFDVYAFLIGEPGSARVGVLFKDITIQKRADMDRQRFVSLADCSVDFIGMADLDLRPFFVNRSGLDMVGLDSLEQALQTSVADFFFPEDQDFILHEFFPRVMREGAGEVEIRFRHFKTGNPVWMIYSIYPVFDEHGKISAHATVSRNITERKRAELELFESRERFRKIVSQAATGVIQTDTDGRIILVNHKMCEMLGYSERELIGKSVNDIAEPGAGEAIADPFKRLASNTLEIVIEKQYRRKDGSLIWANTSASPLRGPAGDLQGMVGIVVDVTDRKRAEEKVRHASLHDPLTGLPNRTMLFEYANHVLAHNIRHHRAAAVLFIDLDRFKPINDTHGHETGDAVLKAIASRLTRLLRAEDIVIRLGGDEFIVLLQDMKNAASVADVTRHIVDEISQPCHIGDLMLSVSASVGVSMFPTDAQDIDMLISHADMAMYRAKEYGRNNYQFYSPEFAVEAKLQLSIERQLKAALKSNGFYLHYQPVFDVVTGEVVSVEALLRWHDLDIGPDRFIPVAEATGMINRIGRWLIQEACLQHKTWLMHGLPPIPIAINASVVEFRDKDFVNRFEQTMRMHGILPSALQLEVTETAVMDNLSYAVSILSQLKALGIKILLDDFGSGYSSLAYLARLPLNKIKIDKSLILPLEKDVASRAVTDAMIALGRTLDLEVVAEGVETANVLDYICSRGCTQAQGFYLGMPMSGAAFETWYRERMRRPTREHM